MLNKLNLILCEKLIVELLNETFVGFGLQQGKEVNDVL